MVSRPGPLRRVEINEAHRVVPVAGRARIHSAARLELTGVLGAITTNERQGKTKCRVAEGGRGMKWCEASLQESEVVNSQVRDTGRPLTVARRVAR